MTAFMWKFGLALYNKGGKQSGSILAALKLPAIEVLLDLQGKEVPCIFIFQ